MSGKRTSVFNIAAEAAVEELDMMLHDMKEKGAFA